jgi:ribokinase
VVDGDDGEPAAGVGDPPQRGDLGCREGSGDRGSIATAGRADARGMTQPGNVVVIVGSVNVDLVVATERLPGRGETVLGRRLERYGGGKGANAAVAAARLGAEARLVAAVGDDALGRDALAELCREGVDVGGVSTVSGEATGAALIVVDGSGDNQIAVGAGANAALAADRVQRALEGALNRAGCLLVSLEVPHEAVHAAVEAGRERGIPVVVNPAPARPSALELAALGPIFTPNAGEAGRLTGETDKRRAAAVLARATGAPVIVTDGSDGALLLEEPGAEALDLPPPSGVTAVDTTGAGDTFSGALATRLAKGDSLRSAAAFAVAAGACAISARGARAGMPTEMEVRAVLGRS